MILSKRLQAILDLIEPCDVLVDIGTDHAHLLIKAIIDNKCNKAYGLDIASGPLSFANHNIHDYALDDKITTMQLDGLKGFKEDADTFVIAGMGFETIMGILSNYSFTKDQTIIVQSNTKNYEFRKLLINNGFTILDEVFFYDNKKPVTILKLIYDKSELDEASLFLGPILKNTENQDYITYLTYEYGKMKEVIKFNPSFHERYGILEAYLEKKGVLS